MADEHTQRSGDRGSGDRYPGKPGGEREIVGGDVGSECSRQVTRSLNSSSVSPCLRTVRHLSTKATPQPIRFLQGEHAVQDDAHVAHYPQYQLGH